MKRTTYIIFGMLVAGLVVVIGFVSYASLHTMKWNDSFLYVEGEMKTVQLPPCKVVKLIAERDVIETRKKKNAKIVEIRMPFFHNLPLNVSQAETGNGTFTYASDMDKFMVLQSSGDTLLITVNFPPDKLEEKYRKLRMLNVFSKAMELSLPAGVQSITSNLENQQTTFRDFNHDTLSVSMKDVIMENCRFRALSANRGNLNFHSGEVENLHLHLDKIRFWHVNADSFHIDTEYLYASGYQNCLLQKGECREVVWMPQSENATLNIDVKQPARIVVDPK